MKWWWSKDCRKQEIVCPLGIAFQLCKKEVSEFYCSQCRQVEQYGLGVLKVVNLCLWDDNLNPKRNTGSNSGQKKHDLKDLEKIFSYSSCGLRRICYILFSLRFHSHQFATPAVAMLWAINFLFSWFSWVSVWCYKYRNIFPKTDISYSMSIL